MPRYEEEEMEEEEEEDYEEKPRAKKVGKTNPTPLSRLLTRPQAKGAKPKPKPKKKKRGRSSSEEEPSVRPQCPCGVQTLTFP